MPDILNTETSISIPDQLTNPKSVEPSNRSFSERVRSLLNPITGPIREKLIFDEEKRFFKTIEKLQGIGRSEYYRKDTKASELITRNKEILERGIKTHPADTLGALTELVYNGYVGDWYAVGLFFEENLPQIESNIISPEDENGFKNIDRALKAISALAFGYSDLGKRKLPVEILTRHFDDIKKGFTNLPEQWNEHSTGYAYALQALVVNGDSNTSREAGEFLREILSTRDKKGTTILAEALRTEINSLQARGNDLFDRELVEYGLDPRDLRTNWSSAAGGRRILYQSIKANNFEQIRYLESQYKGIAKFLVDEYGIKNFHRYPAWLLLQQYEQHQDVSTPYGIVLFPRYDHNGAFSLKKAVLEEFASCLMRQEAKYNIKIVEVESKYDIARSLIKMSKHYGPGPKISFAIIGGHGEKDSIRFGGYEIAGLRDVNKSYEKYILHAKDLFGAGVRKAGAFFEPDPQIVLVSCSTGARGGIGEQLSYWLGARVVAPKRPTDIKKIKPSIVNGRLFLDAEYTKRGVARSYAYGHAE